MYFDAEIRADKRGELVEKVLRVGCILKGEDDRLGYELSEGAV